MKLEVSWSLQGTSEFNVPDTYVLEAARVQGVDPDDLDAEALYDYLRRTHPEYYTPLEDHWTDKDRPQVTGGMLYGTPPTPNEETTTP